MKIKNENITIKIGNKENTFTNLILNNYIDLYAESFISFKNKSLQYCAVKFTDTQNIDENSTQMSYDVLLKANLANTSEIFLENMVINKYIYNKEDIDDNVLANYAGQNITGLGFGNWNDKGDFEIYAYLDVSKYNLTFQKNQQIIISRTDKITTDLKFYSAFNKVKFPVHLTARGILEMQGMEYNIIRSELYSIGTGTLYNVMTNEIPVKELDFRKTGTGIVTIESAKDNATYPSNNLFPSPDTIPGRPDENLKKIEIENKGEGLYPSSLLLPSSSLFLRDSTDKWIIYKFKLWRERWEGEKKIVEDTHLFYFQSQLTDNTGKLKLEIKYEKE